MARNQAAHVAAIRQTIAIVVYAVVANLCAARITHGVAVAVVTGGGDAGAILLAIGIAVAVAVESGAGARRGKRVFVCWRRLWRGWRQSTR